MKMSSQKADLLTGVLIALVVAALINLPLWFALFTTDEAAYPDIVIESQDEDFYLARIQEVADGYPAIGQPFVFELRDQTYPLGTLPELVMGTFQSWTGLELKEVSIIFDALAPFLLVLLTWIAIRPFVPTGTWRALFVGIIFLGENVVHWKRPISPQITFLFFLPYLGLFLHSKRSQPMFFALRSALIGVMLYSYPYHWTYALAAEGLLVLHTLWQQQHWRNRLKTVCCAVMPFALVAVPFAIGQLAAVGDTLMQETLQRLGGIESRWPTMPVVQVHILLTIGFLFWSGRKKKESIPLFILLIAGLAMFNQPVITGVEILFNHYAFTVRFAVWIAILWSIGELLKNRVPLNKSAQALAAFCLILLTTTHVSDSFSMFVPLPVQARNEKQELLTYLTTELPPNQVILSTRTIALDLPIYTSHYPFFSVYSRMHRVSDDELALRAAVYSQFLPHEPLVASDIFGSYHFNKGLNAYQQCRLFALFTREECRYAPDQYLVPAWGEFQAREPLTTVQVMQILRERHVGYVILDVEPPFALRGRMQAVKTIGELTIYRINESGASE